MPCLTKVSFRYYNWQIRCLCMGGGGGEGSARLPHLLHTLDYPCKPLYTLVNTCIPFYTPILPIYLCGLYIPLHSIPLYTSVYSCIPHYTPKKRDLCSWQLPFHLRSRSPLQYNWQLDFVTPQEVVSLLSTT